MDCSNGVGLFSHTLDENGAGNSAGQNMARVGGMHSLDTSKQHSFSNGVGLFDRRCGRDTSNGGGGREVAPPTA